jgi:hypothetical protein
VISGFESLGFVFIAFNFRTSVLSCMYAQFLLQLIFYGKNVEEYGDFT